ncbi:MAG: sulfite exporter TauE/SafE family protein [Rhodospirillales bacterium]|jgi:hypothetical protein
MPELSSHNLLFSFSGFLVGLLVGQTGVGGGSLMTPILVLLFGIHPTAAVGTDLLYACVTKSVGTLVHGKHKTVDWRIVRRLAIGSVPAALATLAFMSIPAMRMGEQGNRIVAVCLGIALLLTSISLVFRHRVVALSARFADGTLSRHTASMTIATGALLGLFVTVSSVGAGALGVTALLFLYPRLPTSTIVGSDIAHAVPLTLVAGLGHWWLGSVDTVLLLSLLFGSIPGVILGSQLSVRVPDVVLRLLLASVLALVGARLVF